MHIHDLAGRPRGTGFVADHHGTVITSHETVDGLPRLVLRAGSDRSCVVSADAVTPLPELDLALVRTEGLGVDPLPVSVRGGVDIGAYVRLPAGCWREARVLDSTTATYTATDRFHLVEGTLELAIGTAGRDALRLGGGAAGGPVLDAATGAVVAVLGTALQSGHRDIGFAVPLRVPDPGSPGGSRQAPGAGSPDGSCSAPGSASAGGQCSASGSGPVGGQCSASGSGSLGDPSQVWGSGLLGDPCSESGSGLPGDPCSASGSGPVGGQCSASGSGSLGDPSQVWGSGLLGDPCSVSGSGLLGDPCSASGSDPLGDPCSASASGSGLLGDPPPASGSSPLGHPYLAPDHDPLAALLAENAATVPAYGVDLNLAGVLELTATSVGQDGPPGVLDGYLGRAEGAEPVERGAVVREFAEFTEGRDAVLGLVGPPGSGRTTELAVLAARRHRSAAPAPTLWLRGADLQDEDASVADAARRALSRAARIVASAADTVPAGRRLAGGDLGDITPERLARLAHAAGRPLFLLLDGPEEMPPVLAHRLADWTDGTAAWLRETGARLVVACREEYWECAGFPEDMLHGRLAAGVDAAAGCRGDGASAQSGAPDQPRASAQSGVSAQLGAPEQGVGAEHQGNARAAQPDASGQARRPFPRCVRLGDLSEGEARRARVRYRIPDGALTGADARHPLTLRLLAEVRAALPGAPQTPADRHDVFSAYLDLMCLRVAVRLAAEQGLRGTAVRRLAAKVAGQVHEAARRSLGPGQGELDRESFEAVFPWGPAPARLGGGTGWASAVLTEGLLVPAGTGYRFAHEELADWIQGTHLDLEEALRALVHRPRTGRPHPLPVPHHRIGPVVQALLLVARQQGTPRLADRLEELLHALDADPHSWWAARLLAEVLLRVPDATPYTDVLRQLADRIVDRRRRERPLPYEFGPAFWTALPVPDAARFDLLRRLVLADGPPQEPGPRFLDTVAELLAADPTAVQPHLARWFDDERPLPATPHATVAKAAQALLHTHRTRALDDLTEILVGRAHRRADELLAVLAEEEPSAVCRAVDRWAHDERPARRVAAVAYGLRAAPHVRTEPDRELLRYAALALLARPEDCTLHGGALALLVRDPRTRARHLPQALGHFAAGDPQFPASALVPALATDPDPVLDAFRERLRRPEAGEALRTLADVTTPALARRVTELVREAVRARPETAGDVAAYVDRRLDHGPAVRAVLRPLVTGLLDGGPERVRAALAAVLAAPGTPESRPLRAELLDFLLDREREPAVLAARSR
ncbi:trypsin-like peptidase domain-containing protein [Streptomyces sp. NPDC047072]|uniref:trypsin-like peptidase domain-containing protein n=1 Tax=Streptomyces sp. NPDC047072 TaxID=3154809 RepID=UPI0033E3BFA5